jgi:hypothetical protein
LTGAGSRAAATTAYALCLQMATNRTVGIALSMTASPRALHA